MNSEISHIIRYLPFAILVTDTSNIFKVLDASDLYLTATLTTKEEIVGKGIFDAFPAASPDADGPSNLRNSLELVLSSKKPHAMDVQRYDVRNAEKNGFVVKYWLPTNIPVVDDEGNIRFIIHRVYDLTELMSLRPPKGDNLKQGNDLVHAADLASVVELLKEGERRRHSAEALALEAGERLELAVAAAELGTFYCPMPLKTIYWNDKCKEHFFLPQDADVDFDLFYSRIHPEDRQRTRDAVNAAVAAKKMYDIEYRVVAPDGRQRWLRAKGRSYFNEKGDATRFDGITIDITKTKENEAELARSNQRKDDFLAMLAHELRNPLAPVRAAADLLELSPNSADIAKVSTILSRQVGHMEALLADLLDVSRVTRGLVALKKERVDCKHVIATAIEQVGPLIELNRHHLQLHIPPAAAYVLGDEKRLVQSVANLLVNAAKYTPPGGQIKTTVSVHDDAVRIAVSDNGIGIPADLLPHVYELFVQGDRTPDRAQGGLGLGLALVKSLVELHGGQVDVVSKGVGAGSTFTLLLPMLDTDAPVGPDVAPMTTLKSSQHLRVVIVDDNVDAAWTLAACLRSVGHQVEELSDPHAALAISASDVPDVFLLDIGMPGMDGYELAHRLRIDAKFSRSCLIAVTGYANAIQQSREQKLFDHYLVKPIDLAKLLALLNNFSS